MIYYDAEIIKEILKKLIGSDKRRFIAQLALRIGRGGQSIIAKEFNVSRNTIRKGIKELKSGFTIFDAYNARGRKKTEDKLPNILNDIKEIVDSYSQTDPKFKSTRLYTRLTVKEVRKRLIEEKNYKNDELPTNQTLNTKINQLGYRLKKVQKTKPLKKIKQTDAIFSNLNKLHLS